MLGGETSGHILCLDRTTTGDGLITALQVLGIMKQTGRSLAELAAGMEKLPQVLLNVEVARRFDPASVPAISAAVRRIEAAPGGRGAGGAARLGHRTGDPRDGRRPRCRPRCDAPMSCAERAARRSVRELRRLRIAGRVAPISSARLQGSCERG